MILHRCFAWRARARPNQADGALWFAQPFQGDGRHDNPSEYGCLYVSEHDVSAVVEQLARFRGQRLQEGMLVRRRLPLALAAIELPESESVIDLDEPKVLDENALRPSLVATRRRELTQQQALALFARHRRAAGLRWWSTFESLWANVTLFDRAAGALRVVDVHRLSLDDAVLSDAADLLGIAA